MIGFVVLSKRSNCTAAAAAVRESGRGRLLMAGGQSSLSKFLTIIAEITAEIIAEIVACG